MSSDVRIDRVRDLLSAGVLWVEDGNHGENRPLSDEFASEGTPFIRPDDLAHGVVDFANCDKINEKALHRIRKGKGRAGDIAFTHRATVGRIARVGKSAPEFVANPGVTLWRVLDRTTLDADYLYYFMQTPFFMNQVWAEAGNTDTFPYISLTQQRGLAIRYPSLAVQRKLGSVLSALDDRISLLRETNATLGAIAQALFKSWFVDFDPVHAKSQGLAPAGMDEATAALFSDRFTDLGASGIPEGWEQVNIGRIAEVVDCLHSKKPELLREGRPFLQLSNIRVDGLLDTSKLAYVSDADYAKWVSRIEVTGGDCVITNVGRVGAAAQIPAGYQAAMGRNMTAIRLRSEWPYPTYLIQLLLSDFMRGEIQRKTDVGTILDALNVRSIPQLRCVVGPHDVMLAFESVCRPIQAAMELNLDRANALAEARETLLPRLMSGQLRLPEADQATAELT